MVKRRKEVNQQNKIQGPNVDTAYGLENLWFNAVLEAQTLWVNLGFWENATHPSEACANLFRKLLDESGISGQQEFSMVEVGCGCAETAQVLLKDFPGQCTQWVGLTISPIQVQIAETRLLKAQESPQTESKYRIFTADAARPDTWSSEVQDSIRSLSNPWLVALDTLVDFRPSREAILSYARQDLGASVAITDHLRKEDMGILDRLKLYASFRLLDTPLNHVLTRKQYIDLLVKCGYKRENISFIPYSEHVYAPYSRFISQQGQRWQEMGGSKWDYMDFSLAGFVTGWWARSELVEACIIVARA
ncbi:hypothetical protein BDW59DRAFT_174997 [Aspergillus cavernicola]|uniref:S-adenosyl-L-methionine-dependent methyltransferase n=1 Tax=Aspergillus cavernicola TaxID=176166 RepID=A0ABR4HU44_9EURO